MDIRKAVYDFICNLASDNTDDGALFTNKEGHMILDPLGVTTNEIDLDLLADQLATVVTDAMKVD